jgi:hypothetical protein
MRIKKLPIVIAVTTVILLTGCSVKRATLKTYVEPSLDAGAIKSIAVFPMRNVRLLPDEAREINRSVTQALNSQNPNLKIIGPAESVDLLNKAELADGYSDFLRDYATSGIPNASLLNKIGQALYADAIMQGEVYDIFQEDGAYGVNKGTTSLTVRYVILSTNKGDVLWEATSNSKLVTATTIEDAPPLYEAIMQAQNKILTALPTLGE